MSNLCGTGRELFLYAFPPLAGFLPLSGCFYGKRVLCNILQIQTNQCHELSLTANRVCTGQSSDSERAND